MLEENVPMMILAEKQRISYHTINNFRSSEHANELVKKSFLYFANLLEAEGLINESMILRSKLTLIAILLFGARQLSFMMN